MAIPSAEGNFPFREHRGTNPFVFGAQHDCGRITPILRVKKDRPVRKVDIQVLNGTPTDIIDINLDLPFSLNIPDKPGGDSPFETFWKSNRETGIGDFLSVSCEASFEGKYRLTTPDESDGDQWVAEGIPPRGV